MKLVTFINLDDDGKAQRVGALLEDNSVLDLALANKLRWGSPVNYFDNMLNLIESGQAGLDAARVLLEVEEAKVECYRLLPPIPLPPQIRDSMCFEQHVQQSIESAYKLQIMAAGMDLKSALEEAQDQDRIAIPDIWYKQPVYYKANRFAISGPDEEIPWPSYSEIMDYEFELACVISKQGKNISSGRASEYIFGYTIFNDFSARDAQFAEIPGYLGPAKGKDFDKANAMGPCIITADEFDPRDPHEMIVRVNGEERSCSSSDTMHWSFEQLIEHVSQGETLHPGEILGSGTVGNGCGLELMQFLNDGDIIELELPSIGILRNTVRKTH